MQVYPADFTDSQWAKIENLFENKKRKHSLQKGVVSTSEYNFIVLQISEKKKVLNYTKKAVWLCFHIDIHIGLTHYFR